MITRYPGIRPFERNDQAVFFGRDEDIEQLGRLIRLEKFVVLNGKSGLGKSSLLKAGVIPELESLGYDLHSIRLGAFDPTRNSDFKSPFETLYTHIKGGKSYLTNKLKVEDSLWIQAKNRQLQGKTGKALVLVMDQFEELFTWPGKEFEHFKLEFATLVNLQMPPELSQTLRQTPIETFSEAQWESIYSPLQIKVVMAIRSDRLALLNQLTDELPDILGKIYELKPMDRESARSAILLPAQQEGNFSSKPFTYSQEAQKAMLDFLSDDFQGRVESFQLQLVCQYIEDYIVPQDQESFTVSLDSLPPLEEIFSNYYNRQIQRIGNVRSQKNARRFIEEGLILEEEERRLSVFEGVIRRRYGISAQHLEQLVMGRLIRAEPLTEGGYTYELAHDTLVPPILEAKKSRKLVQQQRRWAIGAILGIILIAGLSFVAFWINSLRLDAIRAKEEAQIQQKRADSLRLVAEVSDSISREILTRALLSDSISRINLQRALDSETLAKQKADEALTAAEREVKAKAETQAQLEISRSWVRRLIEQFPSMINQLRFEEAQDLVLQAITIGIETEQSLLAAAELIFFYSEAHKFQTIWPIYKATRNLNEETIVDKSDSLKTLQTFLMEIASPEDLGRIKEKYYPDLVEITGDTFWMGNEVRDTLFVAEEGILEVPEINLHKVSVSDFQLGRTELTFIQYRLYCEAQNQPMPEPPSWGFIGDNPIIQVSWWDAVRYANWLSEKRGLNQVYFLSDVEGQSVKIDYSANGFRLPTEAEWEYAAGGGIMGREEGKKKILFPVSNNLKNVCWFGVNSDSRTQPVGQKAANELGLYDMSGNVWEWCQDWFGVYPQKPQNNPKGPIRGEFRVLRGGSWRGNKSVLRISHRYRRRPRAKDHRFGFRLARSLSK